MRCKEELRERPGTFTESWSALGLQMRRRLEEEHSRQRGLVEVEECVVCKAKPKFMSAEGVQLAGAGQN